MTKPFQHVRIEIEDVNLYPGMSLTVWLNRNRLPEERNAVQVELRVNSDGTLRLYSHKKEIELKDFEDWFEDRVETE